MFVVSFRLHEGDLMERILWILTILGVVIGSVIFLQGLVDDSAPRQAAAAGLALCCAVLPYVLARSVREFNSSDLDAERNKYLRDLLDELIVNYSGSSSANPDDTLPVDLGPPSMISEKWIERIRAEVAED